MEYRQDSLQGTATNFIVGGGQKIFACKLNCKVFSIVYTDRPRTFKIEVTLVTFGINT